MSNRKYEGDPIDMTYSHLSESGETVGGTSEDDEGNVTTDNWPSAAPPRDELNEDYVKVIEAAADPARSWDSVMALAKDVVPNRAGTYANTVLSVHWPEKYQEMKDDRSTVHNDQNRAALAPDEVVAARERVLDGEIPSEVVREYPVKVPTLRHYLRGKKAVDPDSPPALSYNHEAGWHIQGTEPEQNELQESSDYAENRQRGPDAALTPEQVAEARRRALAGEPATEIATEYPVAPRAMQRYIGGDQDIDPDDPPALTHVAGEGWVVDDETGDQDETSDDSASSDNKEAPDNSPTPDPAPSGSGPHMSMPSGQQDGQEQGARWRAGLLAAAAFLIGWAVGR